MCWWRWLEEVETGWRWSVLVRGGSVKYLHPTQIQMNRRQLKYQNKNIIIVNLIIKQVETTSVLFSKPARASLWQPLSVVVFFFPFLKNVVKIGLFCFYRNDFPNFGAEIGDTFRAMINFVRIKYPKILIFSEIVALFCFCKSARNNSARTELFIKISFFCIHSSLNNIGRKSGSSANTFSYNFLQLIFSNLVYQCVENCFYYLLEVLLRAC